jgi:hypothetical protein
LTHENLRIRSRHESLKAFAHGKITVRDLMRTKRSRFFEIARLLVRLDHVASFIVNADHSIMWEMRIQVAENEWNRYENGWTYPSKTYRKHF